MIFFLNESSWDLINFKFVCAFSAFRRLFNQNLKLEFVALIEFKWFNLACGGEFFVLVPEKELFECVCCLSPSVHVSINLLQQWVKWGVFCFFDLLHQLCMLGDQLPEVRQFLQQSGEKEGVIGVIGQEMELQHSYDALLHPLNVCHVHQAWTVWSGKKTDLKSSHGLVK